MLKDKYFIIVTQIRSKSCGKIEWSNATATTRSQERGKTLFRNLLFTRDFVSLFSPPVHRQWVDCAVHFIHLQKLELFCSKMENGHPENAESLVFGASILLSLTDVTDPDLSNIRSHRRFVLM